MDEREQIEPGAGPASPEAEAKPTVTFEESEAALLKLANKYRHINGGQVTPNDVDPDERDTFGEGWNAQQEHWKEPYEDFVKIINDINSYLALRYKGVPDLLVAAAAMASANHLMGLCTYEQVAAINKQNKSREQRIAEALAEKLGLAVAEPGGHG